MKLITVAAAALALMVSAASAAAQQKSIKDRLVGTWHFVIAEVTAPDGKKSFPFGPSPRGMVIFTADGHFTQVHIAAEVPKIANGNRLNASPEEYAGIMRGTIAQFGTYTVDEEKKTFTMKFSASTFPNWDGIEQKRPFTLTGDELKWTVPAASSAGTATAVWKRAK